MGLTNVTITDTGATDAEFETNLVSLNPNGGSATAAHKVVISIAVMIVFIIIITEVAGISKQWAMVAGGLLLSSVLILIMHLDPKEIASIGQYPVE